MRTLVSPNDIYELVNNGRPLGTVAERFLEGGGDPGFFRPFVAEEDGKSYIAVRNRQGGTDIIRIQNAATLRKDEWIELDRAILEAAKIRLRVVADFRTANLVYNVNGGLGATVLQTETQSDIGPAAMSMDGIVKQPNDRPEYGLGNLPLPLQVKDFHMTLRQLQASRMGNSPLDTAMGAAAGRKVSELQERLFLGVESAYTFGGGTLYGLTNHPSRIPQSLTDPAATAWTPATLVGEILEMVQASRDAKYYGPWMLYFAPVWSTYLDADYSTQYPGKTLRQRIMDIEGITLVATAEYLTDANYDVVLVSRDTMVARLVLGMETTTLQWDTEGGLQQNFKVFGCAVPQIRADFDGNTGLVHGTV